MIEVLVTEKAPMIVKRFICSSKVNCNLQTVEIGGGSCTASMIAEDWLITAQHCVDNSGLNFADTNEHGDKVLISIRNVAFKKNPIVFIEYW